ncbi:MAG: 50S ribosomal protein L18 [Desulfurococcales archaeon]|nr:50S ribosomal protein L18 [Desulfurococcales archaeon]
MGRGPRYKVPRRRRRGGKTNYKKRYVIIMSRKIRFVVRPSLKHVNIQIIQAKPVGDETIAAAHSMELAKKYGWKGGTSNTSAAYLTGFLAGLKALKAGVKEAILDIGFITPVPGGKVFAALKGALDAGLIISHGDKMIPSEDRIKGEHIASYASTLKEENPEKYERLFSHYLKNNLPPENLSSHFEEVLSKIKEDYEDVISTLNKEEVVKA